MANGQFWLTPRVSYERAGGHAAVKERLVEDVALARRYRDLGMRLRFAWAPPLGSTRMYRDRHEMFEGLLKNAHGVEFSAARQTGTLAALAGLYLLPLALLPVGILEGSAVLTALGAVLWIALFGKHIGFAASLEVPWWYGLLYPAAIGWYLVLLATSLNRGIHDRPVSWKGRTYALDR